MRNADKENAIRWFKEIQGGSGVDRSKFPDAMKGNMAKRSWHDSMFTYGVEYGVLIALRELFNITEEDLKNATQKN